MTTKRDVTGYSARVPAAGQRRSATDRGAMLSLVGMVLGLAVTLASVAWMAVVKPSTVWTPDQALEYQRAGEALHAARSPQPNSAAAPRDAPTAHATSAERTMALIAAQERFNRIGAQLERARDQHQRWGRWAAGTGLALTILSGLGYLASRPA